MLSIPFALLSAKNLWKKHTWLATLVRGLLSLLHSVPALICAILFVRVVGPGLLAGDSALGIQLIGMLGKLIGDELDRIDETPIETKLATGSTKM